MRFWFGTCVILAPVIVLPAAMNGWPGTMPKQQLTAEQKQNYKIAYNKENYFTCDTPSNKSSKGQQESEGCKNAKILEKAKQKLKETKPK